MSDNFINQITLNCLLNNDILNRHLINQKAKKLNKKEKKFYRKRIYNLFKDMILGNIKGEELNPDVKYAYDNNINAAKNYFKTTDNKDLIQCNYKVNVLEEEDEIILPLNYEKDDTNQTNDTNETNHTNDTNVNKEQIYSYAEGDNLLIRTVKIDPQTLDRYVKKTTNKKKDETIFPKQNINLKDIKQKNKGLKKKNIANLYEDYNEKEEEQNEKVI